MATLPDQQATPGKYYDLFGDEVCIELKLFFRGVFMLL